MTSRLRVIILAGGLALSASLAFAITRGDAGAVHAAHKAADRLGSALIDFYAALPPGVPVGP